MYSNRVYKIWILDSVDYFLISLLITSLIAQGIKKYRANRANNET